MDLGVEPIERFKPERWQSERVLWRRYKSNTPVKCEECMRLLISGEKTSATFPSAFVRVKGEARTFWCYSHARAARTADEQAERDR